MREPRLPPGLDTAAAVMLSARALGSSRPSRQPVGGRQHRRPLRIFTDDHTTADEPSGSWRLRAVRSGTPDEVGGDPERYERIHHLRALAPADCGPAPWREAPTRAPWWLAGSRPGLDSDAR
jgi:hypothetical protein